MNLAFRSIKKKFGLLSGELESPIMDILWKQGGMMGRDLYLEVRWQKDVAYTTVLTVLDRLSKKGFIKKNRDSGRIVFCPRVSREDYLSLVTGGLIAEAFALSPDLAVSAFAGLVSRMPKQELDRLEKLIKEKKK